MAALNREIDFIGDTSKCNTYLQYSGDSLINVFFDIEWVQNAPIEDGTGLNRVVKEVINHVLSTLCNLTAHSHVGDEVVVQQCHRPMGDQWKASFRVIFPDFCCKANALNAMAEALDLPYYVDRTPFTGMQATICRICKVPKFASSPTLARNMGILHQ